VGENTEAVEVEVEVTREVTKVESQMELDMTMDDFEAERAALIAVLALRPSTRRSSVGLPSSASNSSPSSR
jgi:hypothetical protein